jgi:fructosamine-3-kinase
VTGDRVVKRGEGAEAEAAGLSWLAEAGGARIAHVLDVAPGRLELERIAEVRPDPAAARAFGVALAATHDAGAAAFGAPPDGWHGPNFIGRRRQRCEPEDSWGGFYAEQRVLPFARIAVEAGSLSRDELDLVERACAAIAAGGFDDDDGPARLHGDLWNGNVLWSAEGVVLIDPAAHGGHRETDLAMLELFGLPRLDDVVAGYESAHALPPGRADRVPVHQLHPLAVHAAGHGRGYGVALADAARRTLDLA